MTSTLHAPDYVPGESFEDHLRRHGCVPRCEEWDSSVGHHEVSELPDLEQGPPLPALVAVTGRNAWFISVGDSETVFAVPITCLVPSWNSYSDHPDEEPHLEWDPAVITAGGVLSDLNENVSMLAMHRGILIGCAPAGLDQAAALAHLELPTVAGPGEDDIGRYTHAQMRLDGRLPFAERATWPVSAA